MEAVGFMGTDNDALYDGAHVEVNCTDINKAEFSYNNAVFTLGAAHMWNYVSPWITLAFFLCSSKILGARTNMKAPIRPRMRCGKAG